MSGKSEEMVPYDATWEQGEQLHPRVANTQASLSFDTMRSFSKRTSHFFSALQAIARYLPKEGPSAREAMKLVTAQRIWMFDVGCAVGQVVGTCYQLESNTLQELEKLWKTGHTMTTLKMQKRNFEVTLANLKRLEPDRKEAQKKIDECQGLAGQMVSWHGQEHKMQHAVMQVIAQFGGSAQCDAFLKELEEKQKVLNKAREQEKEAAKAFAQISGKRDELQCKSLLYESIASNEKGSLSELQRRAQKLDQDAAEKAKEAASTLNIEYKKRSGWFGLNWVTDWVDNRGDCAKWRAERFKEIAKEAKESEGDQVKRAKKAEEAAAECKGELTTVGKDFEEASKNLARAVQASQAAAQELLETKDHCKALQAEFGNLDLHQIAILRDHMQAFPELLGAQGMQDEGMFACMTGAMRKHEMLCARFQKFLEAETEEECKDLLGMLNHEIQLAIKDSQFFSQEMQPLQQDLQKRLDDIKPAAKNAKEAIEDWDVISEVATPSRKRGDFQLGDEDPEDDCLF